MVTLQATIIAYMDDFKLLMIMSLAVMPLVSCCASRQPVDEDAHARRELAVARVKQRDRRAVRRIVRQDCNERALLRSFLRGSAAPG
jgi:hypothetical protein